MKARVHRPYKTLKSTGERKRYEHWFYACKVYGSGCPEGHTITEARALRELTQHIHDRLNSITTWAPVAPRSNIGDTETRIADLENAQAEATRKVKRAHTAYVDAPDDMASMALEELNRRRSKLQALDTDLKDARQRYAQAMTAPSGDVDLDELRDLLARWEDFDDNDKRTLIETMIDYAVVRPPGRKDRLEIHWAETPRSPSDVEGLAAPLTRRTHHR